MKRSIWLGLRSALLAESVLSDINTAVVIHSGCAASWKMSLQWAVFHGKQLGYIFIFDQ